MTAFLDTNSGSSSGADADTYVALDLGDYSIRLVRYLDDAASGGMRAWYNFRIALYKNDVLIGKSAELIGSDVTTKLLGGDPVGTGHFDNGSDFTNVIRANAPATNGNTVASTTSITYKQNAGFKDIKIVVKDGTMTISDVNDVVHVSTEVTAGEFDNITPNVHMRIDYLHRQATAAIFQLKATVVEGDSNEPVEPVENINLFSAENISNWIVTRDGDKKAVYAGAVDLTDMNLDGITGALNLTRTGSSSRSYVYFDYSRAIDFGNDFIINMTPMIYTANTSVYDASTYVNEVYVALNIGDYSIRLIRKTDDALTEEAGAHDKFRVAIYKDDLQVAISELITKEIRTSLYNGTPSSENSDLFGRGGSVSTKLRDNSIAGNGVDYYTSTAPKYGDDTGWNDVNIAVKNGTMTITDVDGDTLLTYDVSGDSFDGVYPQVYFKQNTQANDISWPLAMFRLETTINHAAAADPAAALIPDEKALTLNDSVAINFLYDSERLAGLEGYTDITANVAVADSNISKSYTFDDLMSISSYTGYRALQFAGLTPELFGAEVTLTVSATYDGETVTATDTYSVKEYCLNQIANSSDGELKELCYRILKYGNAVVDWSGDGTKSDVTYSSAATEWTNSTHNANQSDVLGNPLATWSGFHLNLGNNVGINFFFKLAEGENIDDYDVAVTGGIPDSKVITVTPDVDGDYKVTVRVYAHKMSEQLNVSVRDAEGRVSSVYNASVEDFINYAYTGFDAAEQAVADAMMNYGVAAYNVAN